MGSQPDPKGRRRRATDPQPAADEREAPHIDALLEAVVRSKASDLIIAAGVPPTMRVDGELVAIPGTPILAPDMAQHLVQGLMTQNQWEEFENELELDFAFGRRGLGRYRVSAFRERGDASAVLRTIPGEALQIEDLGLPRDRRGVRVAQAGTRAGHGSVGQRQDHDADGHHRQDQS